MGSIRKAPRSDRWEARYRDPFGVQRTRTFDRKTEAKAFLAAAETAVHRGEWRDPALARIRFAEWADEYLEGAVHKRATTLAQDRQRLRKHILPFFGGLALVAIKPLDVRRFVEQLNMQLAPSTVRTVYGTFRAIMTAAVDAELLAVSPCRGVKLPAKRPTEKRVLTVEELHHLANAMSEASRPMVYLAAVTSMRWEEIVALRVGRLNFMSRTPSLTVMETYTEIGGYEDVKTPAGRRTIHLPPFLVAMLAEHLARRGSPSGDELVFVAPRGGQLRMTNFHRREWLPATRKAGLQGFTFHGLRHSTVALMVEMGHHPLVIQKRLGHSSSQTTMDVYGHVLAALDESITADFETLLGKPRTTRPHGEDVTG
ncbi:MAG: site-specific integrase [Actinobacteria bacterium]|nr:site-specific integrase [Actinomycetota bacterium]